MRRSGAKEPWPVVRDPWPVGDKSGGASASLVAGRSNTLPTVYGLLLRLALCGLRDASEGVRRLFPFAWFAYFAVGNAVARPAFRWEKND